MNLIRISQIQKYLDLVILTDPRPLQTGLKRYQRRRWSCLELCTRSKSHHEYSRKYQTHNYPDISSSPRIAYAHKNEPSQEVQPDRT